MLKIENLHAEIDGKEILKGLSLSVNAGEVHAIMGLCARRAARL
jgi:Fe-S cluster assembly ATP-binding protein